MSRLRRFGDYVARTIPILALLMILQLTLASIESTKSKQGKRKRPSCWLWAHSRGMWPLMAEPAACAGTVSYCDACHAYPRSECRLPHQRGSDHPIDKHIDEDD